MKLFIKKEWNGSVKPGAPVDAPGISPLLQELLYNRGIRTNDQIRRFLNPSIESLYDPFALNDMKIAADRIRVAADRGEPICIYGDYDVDGICASSILFLYLTSIGANVTYYIPSRHQEGYGLNCAAVERLHKNGIKLLITVDNGISAIEEAKLCKKLNIELIVTDHHQCGAEIPECLAVVAHTRPDNSYPESILCGAGLALKLVQAIGGVARLEEFIPLAGLATVADVVPLTGENRVLTALALQALNRGECNRGLRLLADKSGGAGRVFSERDLAFLIAPKLNAAGRLADACLGVKLFCSQDEAERRKIADCLCELNNRRQKEEQSILEEAEAAIAGDNLAHKRAIVLYSPGWNTGVIGIAASKLAEKYHRPVLLFGGSGGMLVGSARSIEGVDLYQTLRLHARYFVRFGGHARAAGLTMHERELAGFINALNSYLTDSIPEEIFIPRRRYELDLKLDNVDRALIRELALLAPFGEGNPQPLLRAENVRLYSLRRIGANGEHLKARAADGVSSLDAVGFSMGERFNEILDMDRCGVLYYPQVNDWNGTSALQLQLKEIRAEQPVCEQEYIKARAYKFYDAFYRNLLYNDTCNKASIISVAPPEALALCLKQSISGSLILCFTMDGAQRLLKKLRELGLDTRADVCFQQLRPSPCAYNAVVLAPVLDELEIWRYERILVYDCAMSKGIVGRLHELAPNARIFAGNRPQPQCADMVRALRLERDGMKLLYTAARRIGAEGVLRKSELTRRMARNTGYTETQCAFALGVFEELSFLNVQQNGAVTILRNAPFRPLIESKSYALAQALDGYLEEYNAVINRI